MKHTTRILQIGACLICSWMATLIYSAEDDRKDSSFRVVGYLPDYRLEHYDLQASKSLTDLIIFSAEPAADGSLDVSRLQHCPWPKLLEFKTTQRVRLWLTIGGWERSAHFAMVSSSPEHRGRFVNAVVEFCLAKRLDGVDLDWEHPTGLQEEQNYTRLLADLKNVFEPHGLQLSVTMAAWQKLTPEAIAAVHYVQVMAYDHDQRHSTFEGAKADVDRLLEQQVPANKIILGLPFYGRHLKTREALTYREIREKFKPQPNQDETNDVYFNGPETIRRKTVYAVQNGLGGVMAWELGQDASDDSALLRVIDESLTTHVSPR